MKVERKSGDRKGRAIDGNKIRGKVFQEILEGEVNELSGIDLSDNSRCSLSCGVRECEREREGRGNEEEEARKSLTNSPQYL